MTDEQKAIAEIIKESEPQTDLGMRIMIFKLSDLFKANTPGFIHEDFYEACGLGEGQFKDLRGQS